MGDGAPGTDRYALNGGEEDADGGEVDARDTAVPIGDRRGAGGSSQGTLLSRAYRAAARTDRSRQPRAERHRGAPARGRIAGSGRRRRSDRPRRRYRAAARRAHDGQGQLQRRRAAHHLGQSSLQGFRGVRVRHGRAALEGGGCDHRREDQRSVHAGRLRADGQRAPRRHQQPLGHDAHAGRLLRRRRPLRCPPG